MPIIISFRLLLKCLPLLEQYLLFAQFYLYEQVASFRVTCKMLYLQLNVFLDLAANGFCVPKDLDLEEDEIDESGEKTGKGGMGLADGEGTKDVSDQIESEDQLEDARPADQEQEKQNDKACKEEEKGIDMSEDFDSKPQDIEKNDDDEEQSDNDENNDLDKEMGETGEDAEQLDKQIWGDDKEESQDDNQQPENEDEKEGTGERIGEKEIGAKDDKDKRKQHDDNDTNHDESQEEENKKEINELNEPEIDEDQINPYHGKFQPQPEPQQLDLPEDINLDEDDKEDKEDHGEEENPFDIDEMKDFKAPENMDVELEKETEKNKENNPEEESSEDEDENCESMDLDGQKTQEELETNQETKENDKENAETENKDEEQNRDEEAEKEEKLQEKAAPSVDDASKQTDAAQQVEEMTEGSRDTVAQQSDQAKDQQEMSAENTQEDSNDNGTGQSESAQQESGHSGSSKQETIPASQRNTMTKSIEKRKNPGKSNEDRSLLDKFEPAQKKLKTIYTQDEISKEKKEDDSDNTDGDKAEMAKHVKDSERFDDYTLDAATEDQVRQQASNTDKEKENQEEEKNDVEMHEDEENNMADNKIKEQRPEKISEIPNDKHKDSDGKRNNIENNQETIELKGEIAETMRVQRGNETTFHTMEWNVDENNFDSTYTKRKRFEIEKMLAEWTQIPSTEEAAAAWNCLCSVTDAAARDLSEKLRLVLEPTQASRLRGDYKTGKRINMRKIIPYIASQFRKDKIWLRRTKPFKRDYQIVLALDDSSSMADNHSKELAFESLSLISKAMTYLEVGQLGVVSFGEQVKMLHPLGEAFTEQSGSRYLYPFLI